MFFSKYSSQYAGSFIEEKCHTVTWHYRKSKIEDEENTVLAICRELVIQNATNQLNVLCGKKIIEVKNKEFDKGSFVTNYLAENKFDCVLALGDDATDEDMFARLTNRGHYTLKVGLTGTQAMYNLIGVSNVHSFLQQICSLKNVAIDNRVTVE